MISVSNVSHKRMNQVINEFSQKVSGGGVGVFFFAGHGMQINNQNFLLPVDFELPNDANDVADQSVSLQSIQDKLADAKARFTLLVIDACRDNPLPKKAGRGLSTARGLAAPSAPNGQVVLFSAGAHQQALDKLSDDDNNPNGLFTREFIPLIAAPGLSVTDALKRVRTSVTSKAKAIGHEQNPALYDQTDGDFFFVAGSTPANTKAATPNETIQRIDPMAIELSFWESIKGSENSDDFRAYLNKYPVGQFIELAQSRLRRAMNSGDKARSNASKEDCPDCPEMVDIPPGEFLMGAARNEVDSGDIERPRHTVKIQTSFAASRFEITVRQFTAFIDATGHKAEGSCNVWSGSNWENQPGKSWRDPGFAQSGTHPVVCVSWNDARAYTSWLSRLTGKHYRLPTESEWEYMARGGTRTSRFWVMTQHLPASMAMSMMQHRCAYTNSLGNRTNARMALPKQRRWAASRPTPSACTTRPAMPGSGSRIASTPITSTRRMTARHGLPMIVAAGFIAVAAGAAPPPCARRREPAIRPVTAHSCWAFGLCGGRIKLKSAVGMTLRTNGIRGVRGSRKSPFRSS